MTVLAYTLLIGGLTVFYILIGAVVSGLYRYISDDDDDWTIALALWPPTLLIVLSFLLIDGARSISTAVYERLQK